jgi:hypothetical protein
MIQWASRLAQTLGDHSRAAELENLHLEIGSRIRDMELNKNFLENRLDEQLQVISEQCAELDRKERGYSNNVTRGPGEQAAYRVFLE